MVYRAKEQTPAAEDNVEAEEPEADQAENDTHAQADAIANQVLETQESQKVEAGDEDAHVMNDQEDEPAQVTDSGSA